jgi:tight adherence protein C
MDSPALPSLFADSTVMLAALLIFIASATFAFSIMALIRSRGAIRRRAAGIHEQDGPSNGSRSLRSSSTKAAQRLLDYTSKHYKADAEDMKVLRRRLVQAGIYDPRAVAVFFAARTFLAAVAGAGAFFVLPMLGVTGTSSFWFFVMGSGILGYVGPSVYIDRRIAARKVEHRAGFPDFLDLMVVCADAGLAMEAALDRVSRELADSYRSLSANIHMATLEMRAGRSMTEALEHLAERLALEEARSFAILIQQSDELGSSITDALRVYSDDMRHKRLSRAEEKAYSLPARLAVPMMLCIFPTLFVVILLPVGVRLYLGNY